MLRLRPYKPSDAEYLLAWPGEEYAFAQWCANKFAYPLTADQLAAYYKNYETDEHAWIMTAMNEDGVPVGHFLMRAADYEKESIHLGFVIMDPKLRGKGCGKEMISLATKYAFDLLRVEKVTLVVFDNNPSAHSCYLSAGFRDTAYREACFPYKEDKWGAYDMVKYADGISYCQ